MATNPLKPLSDYSRFVTESFGQPNVKSSTVAVWSDSPYTGIAEGEVIFTNGLRFRMREEVDFDVGLITSYGAEIDDFNREIELTRKNKKLMKLLDERGKQTKTYTAAEVRAKLGLS